MINLDSPEKVLEIIPVDIGKNLIFRQELHSFLAKDKGAQKVFLELCAIKPQIMFNSTFWTFNPRSKPGYRNIPFILRPRQSEGIDEIKNGIDTGSDLLINKSRDEGATWLITAVFFNYWLLIEDSIFLVASRKEDLVDKAGNTDCLFYRFLYLNKNLPAWLAVPEAEKTHLHYYNPRNGSVIDGESTNESLGAGSRALAVMLDEFGRVEHKIAQNIRETLSDVTDCVIYNSTHFYGRGHPFAKLQRSRKVQVFRLAWYDNPEKNKGLYNSPDINVIELFDDYYKEKYPKVFSNGKTYHYSEIEKDMFLHYPESNISFIADGADKFHSIWYDEQITRRDPRDIAQNIDMNPIGAGDTFFDPAILERIRQKHIIPPKYQGEIKYKLAQQLFSIEFKRSAGKQRFKWWGELFKNRPRQDHNYIVACDISLGVGASNSVAKVYDVNDYELVGIFACPNTPPEEFADQTVAICHWVGGASKRPFLIWEANGPGGSFGKRIRWHNYNFVYILTDERARTRKRKNRRGWYSGRESKYDLLLELRIAIATGLKDVDQRAYKKLIIHDEDTIREYEDYIFYENGEIGLSECVDESTGARSAHGDRVIPDGLFVLALNQQPRAAVVEQAKITEDSLAYRRWLYKEELKREEGESPWLYR